MSSLTVFANRTPVLPNITFRPHHHGADGVKTDAENVTNAGQVGQVGQLPVGVGQGLLSHIVQSLEQVVSGLAGVAGLTGPASAAAAGAAPAAAGAVATPNVTQDMHGFTHALFQALNTSPSTGPLPVSGAGAYQAGTAASLQSLLQQVSAGGTQTPAVAGLTASFQQLAQDLGANGSSASLQKFLGGLLQTLQGAGHVAPNLVGANVNARV